MHSAAHPSCSDTWITTGSKVEPCLFLTLVLPVKMHTQESLNPNNLEYWMEDIYTPGYDSLLKRKEAEFRRAKVCKIGALIAAATCTVILVIVVPICTMKS
ncbi:major intrinsically disordered Notch2-binding receptor 1-like [Xiphias gladius]|uniref:major intrinsically disordered Notch2-binding receptor 1-like n=1 Tax=Xiphias gladius TaxID=8245 RepID=UPI001A99D77F|nr:major intrinsically disordered Notch2-binding receptor 1-like [Xiphias gladius]